MAESGGCRISPQAVCAASFITVGNVKLNKKQYTFYLLSLCLFFY